MTAPTPEATINAAHRAARPHARRAIVATVVGWSLGLIGALRGWALLGVIGMGIFLGGWLLFAITWYRVVTLKQPSRKP